MLNAAVSFTLILLLELFWLVGPLVEADILRLVGTCDAGFNVDVGCTGADVGAEVEAWGSRLVAVVEIDAVILEGSENGVIVADAVLVDLTWVCDTFVADVEDPSDNDDRGAWVLADCNCWGSTNELVGLVAFADDAKVLVVEAGRAVVEAVLWRGLLYVGVEFVGAGVGTLAAVADCMRKSRIAI